MNQTLIAILALEASLGGDQADLVAHQYAIILFTVFGDD